MNATRHCKHCGEPFTGHATKLYCNKTCKDKYRRNNPDSPAFTCEHCGDEFRGNRTGVDKNMFCSRRCMQLHATKQARPKAIAPAPVSKLYVCADCGWMWASVTRAKYCEECRHGDAARIRTNARCRERHTPKQNKQKACEWCGSVYHTRRSVQKFCCTQCASRSIKMNARHRRRQRKNNNGPSEAIKRGEVFDRDKWRCGICGDKVDGNLEHPHPLSASVDHVIPLSKGGTHTRDNVQCAHLVCNSSKGDGANQTA